MASARVLRLAGAAALVAAALPVTTAPASASWPGTNGSIFVLARADAQRTIERYDPDGTFGETTATQVREFSNHSTSPDGTRLAYSKNGDIYLVDLETFQETPVVQTTGGDHDPVFSFDGRYLVYVSDVDDDADIYMQDLTDPNLDPVNLTNNTGIDDFAPAFGNDGTGHGDLIAYVSVLSNSNTDIFTMTPGGTDKTNLTNSENELDFGPDWHPGFDMLAYSSQDAEGRDQLHTMSWDGTGKDQLTDAAAHSYEPAWSPDGTQIVFTRQGTAVGSLGRIFIRSGQPGGTETPLTPVNGIDYDRADWQAHPGGCDPDCGGEPIQPTLVFSLKKHVVVSGSAIGQGGDGAAGGECGVGTPIKIQRRVDGRFKTIASATTNADGNFSKKVPDRPGKYRIVSTQYSDAETGNTCLASQAAPKTHRHAG